jgi:disulfide bond formation protein DsbB
MADFTNSVLTTLTVLAQIMVIILVIFYIKNRKNPENPIFAFVAKNGILLAFIVASIALLGSLTYSDILGYEPCKFCWFQRIAMYPQVILLGIALFKRDITFATYSISLSAIGALIALNHYILQLTGTSVIPCSAVGYSISCSKVFVLRMGYITIPLMALSAFLLMIIAMMYARKNIRNNGSTNPQI